jgi:hypothetical protein
MATKPVSKSSHSGAAAGANGQPAEKALAAARVDYRTFRYNLLAELMNEVKELAGTVTTKSDADRIVRDCTIEGGGTNLGLAEKHLYLISYCIANDIGLKDAPRQLPKRLDLEALANKLSEEKAEVDMLRFDIPEAVRMIIRLHLIDGDVAKALITSRRFGMEGDLEEEKANALIINTGAGRRELAARLSRTNMAPTAEGDGEPKTMPLGYGGLRRNGISLREAA